MAGFVEQFVSAAQEAVARSNALQRERAERIDAIERRSGDLLTWLANLSRSTQGMVELSISKRAQEQWMHNPPPRAKFPVTLTLKTELQPRFIVKFDEKQGWLLWSMKDRRGVEQLFGRVDPRRAPDELEQPLLDFVSMGGYSDDDEADEEAASESTP